MKNFGQNKLVKYTLYRGTRNYLTKLFTYKTLMKTLDIINKLKETNSANITQADKNYIDFDNYINWGIGMNKEEYNKFENIINKTKIDTPLYTITSWCDASGYDYWVKQQEEDNYIIITIKIKKDFKAENIAELDMAIDAFENRLYINK